MSEPGRYIYSIIKENKQRELNITGIDRQKVSFLPYQDMVAVVSPCSIRNFDRFSKQELREYVASHEKVNAALLKEYDVVPMSFGMISQSETEVLTMLKKAYLQFKLALENFTKKAEFAIQIFWDEKRLIEEIFNNDPKIRKSKSPKNIMSKLKLGRLISEKLEEKRKEYLKEIELSLKESYLEMRRGKISQASMIGNFALLINKGEEYLLDQKMQQLGKEFQNTLSFKYIGPMPPYSFTNINLKLGNFELIDQARKSLDLGKEASWKEIKQAYYILSHRYHPDLSPGFDSEQKMKEIAKSFHVLENYCQSFAKLGKNFEKFSFKKEEVENSLIVK